ncbi:hypothetical protein [Aromatoleum aromaticum]|nr:hypothetical protein [Aromatoleum aromaticum]
MLAPVIPIRQKGSVAARDHLGIVEDLAAAQGALWAAWARAMARLWWGL